MKPIVMTFHPTSNPNFWKETADTCYAQERFDKALEAYTRITELTPYDTDAWICRGKTLLKLERAADAVASLERALVLSPDNIPALRLLADAFEIEGAFEKRAACLIRLGELES